MKHLLFILLACFVFSSTVMAESDQDKLSRIAGAYDGKAFNGEGMDPVSTMFFLNASDEIVGKYVLDAADSFVTGELSNFRTEGDFTVVADWKDRDGEGVLRMLFSANYALFYGFWGKSKSDTTLPWLGVKQ